MKGGYWVPAQIDDEIIHYKFEGHSPQKLKGLPWLYCKFCGLMYLNNSITKWCIKMGCSHEYHYDYKKMLRGG